MASLGWTRADQAELDVLVWAFIDAHHHHRELGCRACYRLNHMCLPLAEAWDAIEAWITWRRLLSKAQYLRREQG